MECLWEGSEDGFPLETGGNEKGGSGASVGDRGDSYQRHEGMTNAGYRWFGEELFDVVFE